MAIPVASTAATVAGDLNSLPTIAAAAQTGNVGTPTATVGAPIVITTTSNMLGLQNGDMVTISGVTDDTNANGTWVISSVSGGAGGGTFTLNGTTANATSTTGGTWTKGVSVTYNSLTATSGVYTISFNGGSLATSVQPLLQSNQQVLDLTAGPTTALSLTFNGASTTLAAGWHTGTAGSDQLSIQNALNSLATIGGVNGSVTVIANAADTVFTITFGGTLANQALPAISASITSGAGTAGITAAIVSGVGTIVDSGASLQLQAAQQVLALSNANTTTALSLAFNGAATTLTNWYSGGTNPTADANAIMGALNGLSTIGGVNGSVTVIANAADTVFTITFGGTLANQALPSVSAAVAAGPGTANVTGIDIGNEPLYLNGTGTNLALESSNVVNGSISGATSPITGTISNTSGVGSPITITTASTTGLFNGESVTITGVAGNTAANGTWTITVLGNGTQFSLNGSTGNNTYGGGGTWTTNNPIVVTTTSSTAGLQAGDMVTVSGVNGNTAANGNWVISNVTGGAGGGTFTLNGTVGNSTYTSGGSWVLADGALENVSGNNIWTGSVTLASNTSIGVDSQNNLPSTLTITGNVQEPTPEVPTSLPSATPPSTTADSLNKVGTGVLVFPNANTYEGQTNINQGIVNIQSSQSLGVPVNEIQELTINGSSTTSFNLSFNGSMTGNISINQTQAALQTAVSTDLNALASIVGIGGHVTVVTTTSGSTPNGNATFTFTFDGGPLAGSTEPFITASVVSGGGTPNYALLQDGSHGTSVRSGATLQLQATQQSFTLNGADNTTKLSLGFNGASTTLNPGWYNGVAAHDAAQIQNALDSLPTIGGIGGSVTVTVDPTDTIFTIAFNDTLAGQMELSISARVTGGSGTTLPSAVVPVNVAYEPLTLNGAGVTAQGTIAGASNMAATQIRITTTSTAGLTSGQEVTISGVGGNTPANGTWTINVIDATHFDLVGDFATGSLGNNYTSGGTWSRSVARSKTSRGTTPTTAASPWPAPPPSVSMPPPTRCRSRP